MSSKKMIQINPNFLSLSKKNKTSKSHQKKKKRKEKILECLLNLII